MQAVVAKILQSVIASKKSLWVQKYSKIGNSIGYQWLGATSLPVNMASFKNFSSDCNQEFADFLFLDEVTLEEIQLDNLVRHFSKY